MKIVATGATGFLGKHVQQAMPKLVVAHHEEFDLTQENAVWHMYEHFEPDVLVHMAADVGGLDYNLTHSASIYMNNLMINSFVVHYAVEFKLKKLVFVSSACAFPGNAFVPTHEHHLWQGAPERSNMSYGLTKRIALAQLEAYAQQYGLQFEYLILSNMYGPGDRSDHVIPDLIRKFIKADRESLSEIEVWGDGNQTRDFLYVTDAARAIKHFTDRRCGLPVTIANGWSIRIADVVKYLCDIFNYKGEIVYNQKRPTGQARRQYDVSRARRAGWEAQVGILDGLIETVHWMRENE